MKGEEKLKVLMALKHHDFNSAHIWNYTGGINTILLKHIPSCGVLMMVMQYNTSSVFPIGVHLG